MKVYIAGPYTKGDVAANVRAAIDAGQRVLDAGHYPYIPHLTHFWHLVHPAGWAQWMALDAVWVLACDALIRLEGESTGADMEVTLAREKGMPVYLGVDAWLAR